MYHCGSPDTTWSLEFTHILQYWFNLHTQDLIIRPFFKNNTHVTYHLVFWVHTKAMNVSCYHLFQSTYWIGNNYTMLQSIFDDRRGGEDDLCKPECSATKDEGVICRCRNEFIGQGRRWGRSSNCHPGFNYSQWRKKGNSAVKSRKKTSMKMETVGLEQTAWSKRNHKKDYQ